MDKYRETITVYKKTTAELPSSIKDCIQNIPNIKEFKIYFGNQRASALETLLTQDIRWLEFVLVRRPDVELMINLHFQNLNNWIELKIKNARANSSEHANFDFYIDECYKIILSVMMFRNTSAFDECQQRAAQMYRTYKEKSFPYMVFMGKKDFLSHYHWPNGNEWDFSLFVNELNLHFYLFIENRINQIFWVEIRKIMNMDKVSVRVLGC